MARSTTTPQATPDATAPQDERAAKSEEQVTYTGRVCAEPILRKTAKGTPVANFALAVNGPNGVPDFHRIVCWKLVAVTASQYLKAGRLVEVKGYAGEQTWKDREGNERTTPQISAFSVEFLNSRSASQQADQAA